MSQADLITRIKSVLPTSEFHYLLAVSGGVDSCVLFDIFLKLGVTFEVAHVNFGLRGTSSDADEAFVRSLCKKNNIIFHCKKATEKDLHNKKNTQIWARNLRYAFFEEIKNNRNLQVLVTAHHANDALETFVINLTKAAGLKGLCGISSEVNKVFRPLLDVSKKEILEYSECQNIQFREDESNTKSDYTRNFIRHAITPRLLDISPNFINNFKQSLQYLNESNDFIQQQIQLIIKEISIPNENYLVIDKEKLFSQSDFVIYELLYQKGFLNRNEHKKIKLAQSGSRFINANWEILVNRNELIFLPKTATNSFSTEWPLLISLPFSSVFDVKVSIWEEVGPEVKSDWQIDKNKIALPLIIRKKQEKDVFYPTGMLGSKKIAKYFKDEKYSSIQKENALLLCDSNHQILGIIGKRQDRRFLPEKENLEAIHVRFTPTN